MRHGNPGGNASRQDCATPSSVSVPPSVLVPVSVPVSDTTPVLVPLPESSPTAAVSDAPDDPDDPDDPELPTASPELPLDPPPSPTPVDPTLLPSSTVGVHPPAKTTAAMKLRRLVRIATRS